MIENEYSEIHDNLRSSFRIMTTTSSFLLIANFTVLGYALSSKSASLIFLGAFFPLSFLLACFSLSKLFASLFFSGISYENKNSQNSLLFFHALSKANNPSSHKKLENILELKDKNTKLDKLYEIRYRFIPRSVIYYTLLSALVQMIMAALLWAFFGWSVFP